MARQVLDHGVIIPAEYSDDWYEDMSTNLNKLNEVIGSDEDKLSEADVSEVALSGDYDDLTNKPALKPVATSGDYDDLTNKPALKPVATSGDYDDLTNKPSYGVLRMTSETLSNSGSGAISNLNSDSKLAAGDYVLDAALKVFPIAAVSAPNYTVGTSLFQITNASALAAVATSGSYDDLNNLPAYGITRFVNAAITDNSNVAFANISSVDKIKAGDFLLDNAGKMYLIASVDTVNETAAVTTPLTQLAVDANVMHLSGNETSTGKKAFSGDIVAKKIVSSVSQMQINAKTDADSLAIIAGPTAADGGGIWIYGKNSSNKSLVGLQVYDTDTSTFHAARLNMDGSFTPTVSNNGLGSQSFKWVSLNGINPGSLSFPNFSNGIDISGYITLGTTTQTYTAPADGWILIQCRSSTSSGCYIEDSSGYGMLCPHIVEYGSNDRLSKLICPVKKNEVYTIVLKSIDISVSAYFYPCQGNV